MQLLVISSADPVETNLLLNDADERWLQMGDSDDLTDLSRGHKRASNSIKLPNLEDIG